MAVARKTRGLMHAILEYEVLAIWGVFSYFGTAAGNLPDCGHLGRSI